MAALGRNITASAASQIVTIVVMLVATPVLLQVLGTEAYGLIAFFLTLQASMVLLDLGLTATLMKKTVEQRSGTVAADAYLALLRAFQMFFAGAGLVVGLVLWAGAGAIAARWLELDTLPLTEATAALRYIALVLVLRFWAGLYRGIVTGAEQLVWQGEGVGRPPTIVAVNETRRAATPARDRARPRPA